MNISLNKLFKLKYFFLIMLFLVTVMYRLHVFEGTAEKRRINEKDI